MNRPVLGLLTAATLTLALTAVTAPSPASPARAASQETAARRSTDVPIKTPQGRLSAYVVNATEQTEAATEKVERLVTRKKGVVVQAWPQIGVVIAHSTRATFRSALRAHPAVVASVGATRTTRVLEGTPTNGIRKTTGPTTVQKAQEQQGAVVPDPRESKQWDMKVIKADQAHTVTDGSSDVLVGILDSGIDHDHPDLQANIDVADSVNCTDAGRVDTSKRGWWWTNQSHGTHVAGTVAAARNGIGIVGVAPNARVASVKVVNDQGFIYPEYAVCGFMWAGERGMDITNNSYYVDPFLYYCGDRPDQAAAMESVRRAVAWSRSQGVVNVAAAGNESTDLTKVHRDSTSPDDGNPVNRYVNQKCRSLPAELPGVVTVSSFEQVRDTLRTRLSWFSNTGLGVIDVGAPGSDVLSTVGENNGYARYSGTSMASPHVAGVLALMKSAHPDWSSAQLVAALESEAVDKACRDGRWSPPCLGTTEDNSYAGEGIVDALAAVSP